ncbi:MAG TPA: monofunctional biosynthetic peptidoglycan transglycosylase, partial [Thermoanaerobaculia bacterium]|nr:monofunctional biosynthetic peptidoglycan transglycosylase [Thermoanaerobaculia bacterium]
MSLVAPSEPRAGDAAAAGGVSRRPRRRRPLRRLLLLALLAALGYGGWLALTWPDVAALAEENPTTTAFVQRARRAARRAERPEPRILWVPYAQISPHLKRAVLAAEDIGFFDH